MHIIRTRKAANRGSWARRRSRRGFGRDMSAPLEAPTVRCHTSLGQRPRKRIAQPDGGLKARPISPHDARAQRHWTGPMALDTALRRVPGALPGATPRERNARHFPACRAGTSPPMHIIRTQKAANRGSWARRWSRHGFGPVPGCGAMAGQGEAGTRARRWKHQRCDAIPAWGNAPGNASHNQTEG